MAAQFPRNSRATPKIGCATPAQLPLGSRATPAQFGRAVPPLSKEREYCVPPSGERHTPMPVSARIEALAARVLRLTVSRHDPELFFVERSDIAGEMRRLARAVR